MKSLKKVVGENAGEHMLVVFSFLGFDQVPDWSDDVIHLGV